ncbi:hypothetical protein FACS1894172_09740 [Spirochaetia bacterium]|nr:hypothetical protein FACS1894164_00680 [Spirochaetia bacterium]GHU32676.1 hypothetical protein FACS1894172_09740 [Spirochaetia bacterium]
MGDCLGIEYSLNNSKWNSDHKIDLSEFLTLISLFKTPILMFCTRKNELEMKKFYVLNRKS